MWLSKSYSILTIVLLAITWAACKRESPEASYNFDYPKGFPKPKYEFPFNPKHYELGRKLFYDPILSVDNSISCGSCHQQFAAFAQVDHPLSHGVNGQFGKRNAPALFNLAWQPTFMWDGGINHIELQPLGPITNPVEMGLTLQSLPAKLNADATYKALFNDAFGTNEITDYHILKAFAQFLGSIYSANSPYDQYIQGQTNALDNDEKQGLAIFTAHCASCHKAPLFTDYSFSNNGLDLTFNDKGRYLITQNDTDMGKFKVPSLRNINLSGPYMHDGRFTTLEQVIDHYTTSLKVTETTDNRINPAINLSVLEKQQLIKFLKTLTDEEFTTNPLYAPN